MLVVVFKYNISCEATLPIYVRLAWLIGTFVAHLPKEELSILAGLVLCFFGGMYPLVLAAGEALLQCGTCVFTKSSRAALRGAFLSFFVSLLLRHAPLFLVFFPESQPPLPQVEPRPGLRSMTSPRSSTPLSQHWKLTKRKTKVNERAMP